MSKLPWETLSVTSRRGAPTSRRQNFISLPRRDVDFPRRDVDFPRRDVDFPRRDVILALLCHVATWIYTSRRHFDPSTTSRRASTHRDVNWYSSLSRRDVNPNVATWACLLSVTSRRHPARRDVTMFLAQEWFILAIHLTYPHSPEP